MKFFFAQETIEKISLEDFKRDIVTRKMLLETSHIIVESRDGNPYRVIRGEGLLKYLFDNKLSPPIQILDVDLGDNHSTNRQNELSGMIKDFFKESKFEELVQIGLDIKTLHRMEEKIAQYVRDRDEYAQNAACNA